LSGENKGGKRSSAAAALPSATLVSAAEASAWLVDEELPGDCGWELVEADPAAPDAK